MDFVLLSMSWRGQESLKGSNALSVSVRIRQALTLYKIHSVAETADGSSGVCKSLVVKLLAWCLIGFL